MEIERSSSAPGRFFLLILASILGVSNSEKWSTYHSATLNRSSFPAGFVFGAASSSYQSEGAAFEDGRSPSIWDTFTHQFPDKIKDHSTGDVADDFYHRYKEDIILMKNIGLDAFRFSISWSRILPKGKISGGVNPLAIEFYNNLINDLLSNGLQPYVALFHWDLPQALEDDYGGLLSLEILSDYIDYADFCFATFGDRVKHWFTFNEPYEYTKFGYATGIYAPGRCSDYIGNCTSGNSATEPYIVGHHIILCHAAALKLYKEKYQAFQKGQIGIILSSWWIMPFSENTVSRKAAQRALDFQLGWFLHPLIYGDYPLIMRTLVGNRLPKFTTSESRMVKTSYDVLGINYYTARYAADDVFFNVFNVSMSTDDRVGLSAVKNGVPIGRQTILSWLYIYPKGIRELLLYIKDKYGNPPMFITENGVADEESIEDEMRIMFHYEHLTYLLKAIKEGADVRGYFIWSFLDDFEWVQGFTARFGITYVDYKNGLKRYPKDSAIWYNKFLQGKNALSRSSTSQWHSEVKETESSSIFCIHETITDSYFL